MPELKEVPEVAQLLATILTGEPVTHGALAVVPLLAPNLDDPDWLTLEEAGARARVTEVSEAGSVPFLTVANGADRPLLLLDGEELIGAKQNRILNTTVLVAAHTEVTIPVSCVEQGRWGYRGRQFRPGDASLYASLRARKAAWVSQSIRAGRGHRADQGEVWAHLADRASQLRVDSATGAMKNRVGMRGEGGVRPSDSPNEDQAVRHALGAGRLMPLRPAPYALVRYSAQALGP